MHSSIYILVTQNNRHIKTNTSTFWIDLSVLLCYDGQWVYYCMDTASEAFLIFTTQLYPNLCNYNAIMQ